MELDVSLSGTIWTVIPIIITIGSVFLSKRIIPSLILGIVVSAFMVADFNLYNTVMLLESRAVGIIFEEGGLFGIFNRWNISIIVFLLGLGVVTSFVVVTGGSTAFSESIAKRVKDRRGVQFITLIVGVILMIDDYFNAMVNSNIGRNISKVHSVPRAKTAYIVDSVAAPMCLVAPISSWATAIMGNIAIVYENVGIEGNIFVDFIRIIPYHFYVFGAISMVIITIVFNFNFLAMKKYEDAIKNTGVDISADETRESITNSVQSKNGTIWDFWIPIIVTMVVTVSSMAITGIQGSSPEAVEYYGFIYSIMDNLELSVSLFLGGLAGIFSSMFVGSKHVKSGEITAKQFNMTIIDGFKSMQGAITILYMSWMISGLIGMLEVGNFVAEILQTSNIYPGFIPFIMFISSALLAFSIGSSWGTFALVLPIAGAVAYAVDITLLLPTMSAVLSGSVFGDHSSPISDTTVLSSAGSGCKVLSHFESQIPYALWAALFASIGYLGYGLSRTLIIGYISFFAAVGITAFIAFFRMKSNH